jgi:hypothetical protein
VCLADAGLFLARLSEGDLKRILLAQIEAGLGGEFHDLAKERPAEIEQALRPTFDLLPKAKEGRIDHDGVRYLLNRFFVQRHGWSINGLQSGNTPWNSSSSKLSALDHVPEMLQELFEARVGGRSSSLQDVVVLAAVIEHLIHDELQGKLETVYHAKETALTEVVDEKRAVSLMELYMMSFLRGESASAYDARMIGRLERNFHKQYPAWNGVKDLIAEIRQDVAPGQTEFSFENVSSMLEVVADHFAPFYEAQCNDLKTSLLDMEIKQSGRVQLVDFYKAALNDGMSQFTESIDTLRHYGILDEVVPSSPRVIIANYVSGRSNCIARTSFYSTCCPNSCESLLGRIEQALGKGDATPDEIISAVEDPQAALEAGFQGLTPWLRNRLNDLAKHHSGRVPLHGRLFAQWMHFAHPRDCIYPHLSAATSTRSLNEYTKYANEIGQKTKFTLADLKDTTERLSESAQEKLDSTSRAEESTSEDSCANSMWTMEEELFVGRSVQDGPEEERLTARAKAVAIFCGAVLMLLVAVASLLLQNGGKTSTRRYSDGPSLSRSFV